MNTRRALRLRFVCILTCISALAIAHGHAQFRKQTTTTQAAPEKGFAGFRMVQTRNIFDPDRRPISPTQTGPRLQTPPAERNDFVALTGIMVTAEKSLAFFSGSRADYNKVLGVNAEIAGAKVTKITPANIEVERDGKRTSIAVGQTVPLDPNAAPAAAPTNLTPPPTAAAGASPSANAPPANASDVLRRMMERRQQETK